MSAVLGDELALAKMLRNALDQRDELRDENSALEAENQRLQARVHELLIEAEEKA